MTVDVVVSENELVVSLHGGFDAANSTGLAERLGRLAKTLQFGSVTINLADCEQLGTMALSGLVGFRLNPSVSDKAFRIRGARPDIERELMALCMERLFVIERSS